MDGILDFFSPQAGQARRRRLDELAAGATYYIPPELRGLLGLIAEANPVRGMERAGVAAGELVAPDATGLERVGAGGRMLSEMAGVVAPAAVAGRVGMPAAEAIQEGLLGVSAGARDVGRAVAERLNQPGPMPTLYSNPVPGLMDESGGIRAYHGSPHTFERFDMSKIGTGEGAQAYGRGLYFAESEGVARSYRDALTDPDAVPLEFDGRPINTPWNEEIRERWPEYFSGLSETDADAMEELLGNLSQVNNIKDIPNVLGGVSDRAKRLYYRVVKPKLIKPDVGAGRMYEVNIAARPENFIDYDVPLSQQSNLVKAQFGYTPKPTAEEELAAFEIAKRESPDNIGDHPAVQEIYRRQSASDAAERLFQRQVQGGGIDEAARIALSEAGIPGIRYLDAGSRGTSGGQILSVEKGPQGWVAKIRVDNRTGAFQTPTTMITTSKPFPTKQEASDWANAEVGGGTRNYVVFDDRLISIVRMYGIAGAAALLGMSVADVEAALAAQPAQQPAPRGLLGEQ